MGGLPEEIISTQKEKENIAEAEEWGDVKVYGKRYFEIVSQLIALAQGVRVRDSE